MIVLYANFRYAWEARDDGRAEELASLEIFFLLCSEQSQTWTKIISNMIFLFMYLYSDSRDNPKTKSRRKLLLVPKICISKKKN